MAPLVGAADGESYHTVCVFTVADRSRAGINRWGMGDGCAGAMVLVLIATRLCPFRLKLAKT